MIDLRFRPLTRWIGEKRHPSRRMKGHFTVQYAKMLDSLERELRHLKARNATVEASFREDQIRNDGWPYGNATPAAPGLILSFDSKHGPLALPCDHFTNWQANLRAIGLHLEHLRLATLYGVGEHGEQYRGWKAIEGPGGENSLDAFAQRIINLANLTGYTTDQVLRDYETFRHLYRAAAKNCHVDSEFGNATLWRNLQEAHRIIEQQFKGRESQVTA